MWSPIFFLGPVLRRKYLGWFAALQTTSELILSTLQFSYFLWTLLQIVFEAVRGVSYRGDIALDDIAIRDGSCPTSGKFS